MGTHSAKVVENQVRTSLEWLGTFPEHWSVVPGFALLRERQVKNLGMQEKTVLSLSYGRVIVKPEEKLRGLVPESFETYQIVEPGDIIIRPTDLQNDHVSIRVGQVRDRGIITSAYICLQARGELSSDYAHLLLLTYDLKKVFYGLGSGLRQNLSWLDFKRLPIPVPDRDEQEQIVRFVRRLDSKVNRLIKAKRRLIELLNEQKQAIIHQAVTRGPDPTAPLKPSGIVWLGELPEHWEVKPLLACFSESLVMNDGLMETNVLSLSYGMLKRKDFEESKGLVPASYETWQIIEENSTVLRLTDLQNDQRSLRVAYSTERGIVSSAYLNLVPKTHGLGRYWSLVLAVYDFNKAFYSLGGGCRQGIGFSELKWLPLPLPPESECQSILKQIDQSLATVEKSKNRLVSEISLIEEYRTRLVADVVTGQLDVRHLDLPEIEETLIESIESTDLESDVDETDDVLEEAEA